MAVLDYVCIVFFSSPDGEFVECIVFCIECMSLTDACVL